MLDNHNRQNDYPTNAKLWRKLTIEQKRPYDERAKRCLAEYEVNLENGRKQWKKTTHPVNVEKWKKTTHLVSLEDATGMDIMPQAKEK